MGAYSAHGSLLVDAGKICFATFSEIPTPRMKQPKHRIIFLHIPKTAGMTLHGILIRQYGKKNMHDVWSPVKIEEFCHWPEEQRASLVGLRGHLQYGAHSCFPPEPEPKYITLLREPIKRVASFYYFVLTRPQHSLYEEMTTKKMTLRDMVESEITRETDNLHVRLISGNRLTINGQVTREMLEQAKAHLERDFSVFGVNDYFDEFLMMAAQYYDWKTPFYRRENVNKKRPAYKDIDAGTIEVIRQNNLLDIELYEWAKKQFEEKWAGAGLEQKLERFRKWNARYQKLGNLKDKIIPKKA